MISELNIIIKGAPAFFSDLWVHLKTGEKDGVPFEITVPVDLLNSIFDPYAQRAPDQRWSDYIKGQIELLGTAIVQLYLKKMRTISEEERRRVSWVLVSITSIKQSEEGICLCGELEPFSNSESIPSFKELT